jgi:hypothetical protein
MHRSVGGIIFYIATALYLLAAGFIGIFGGNGGEFYGMVSSILGGGELSTVIAIIFALAATAAGALLFLQFFGMEFGIIEIILIAFCILWILFILVEDIIVPLRTHPHFLSWLRALASHLIVLGAVATGTRKLGGS